jgi:hypothetical protein
MVDRMRSNVGGRIVDCMNIPDDVAEVRHQAHVVVHSVDLEPTGKPFRRVDILGQTVGHAYKPGDVAEFMRRAGLDTALYTDPGIVEWRGGGSDVWE